MKIDFGVLRFSESCPMAVAHPNKKKLPSQLKPVETNSQITVNHLLAQKNRFENKQDRLKTVKSTYTN